MGRIPYRELMTEFHTAHSEFNLIWESAASTAPAKRDDPKVVSARERFWKAYQKLWDSNLVPLRIRFLENPEEAADDVIDFLEVDIPAFRCGYEKEYYLQHLKNVTLDDAQKARLRETLVRMCGNDEFRRELRRWGRLMINMADEPFVLRLKNIIETKPWPYYRKAKYVLDIILNNRKDIRVDYKLLPFEKEPR